MGCEVVTYYRESLMTVDYLFQCRLFCPLLR
jgi:hypothetical protein